MVIFFESDGTLEKQIFSLLATSRCQMQTKIACRIRTYVTKAIVLSGLNYPDEIGSGIRTHD